MNHRAPYPPPPDDDTGDGDDIVGKQRELAELRQRIRNMAGSLEIRRAAAAALPPPRRRFRVDAYMLGLVLGIPLWGLFAAALGPWVAVMIMVSVWPVTLLMFVCPFFWMIR